MPIIAMRRVHAVLNAKRINSQRALSRNALLGLVIGLGALAFSCAQAQPAKTVGDWPKVDRETRPWTRWWWMGSIATKAQLTCEMEKYAAAGIGGLEITPIYGVRGRESDFTDYLSDRLDGAV